MKKKKIKKGIRFRSVFFPLFLKSYFLDSSIFPLYTLRLLQLLQIDVSNHIFGVGYDFYTYSVKMNRPMGRQMADLIGEQYHVHFLLLFFISLVCQQRTRDSQRKSCLCRQVCSTDHSDPLGNVLWIMSVNSNPILWSPSCSKAYNNNMVLILFLSSSNRLKEGDGRVCPSFRFPSIFN